MKFLLANHIDNAIYSLKTSRLRTFLTVLGLTIGVASITAIMTLSGGVTAVIDKQVSEIGGNIAVVRPGGGSSFTDNLTDIVSGNFYRASTLTEADVSSLQEGFPKLQVAPIMTMNATLKSTKYQVENANILATTPALLKTTPLKIDVGQFIDTTTDNMTAVVGADLAVKLFGTTSPLGQTFDLHGHSFTIIGVLQAFNNPFNYDGVDFDNSMVVNLDAGKLLHNGFAQIQQLTIKAPSSSALDSTLPKISATLKENHGEHDFTVVAGKDIATMTSGLFRAVTSVMSAIAAIALVVGGIGVMNIMLVGVAERTREIGIRKSVGASSGTIVMQFLVEAILMSIAGGIIGYAAGLVIAFVATTQLYFVPVVTWQSAVAALVVALGVGVIFGLYPAVRAARKNPIESLRQYR